jgi:predicted flap endonuclease-1-like 5' DNA nuclease
MKNFLFIILVVVAAVLLWAIRTNAFAESGLAFSLGLVVAALSGYLVTDYFSRLGKQSMTDNLGLAQKENQALKERVDLLQTQMKTATPHAEVEQFEQRVALLEEEKAKLDGISRAQTAEIASLKEKNDTLQKSNLKLNEDATIGFETAKTQSLVMQEALASAKIKIQELTDENIALREHNTSLTESLDAKNVKTDPDTEGVIDKIVAEETSDTSKADGETASEEMTGEVSETTENESLVAARGLVITELLMETESEEAANTYGTSDNLQAIEGIGSKVDAVLKEAGIGTWEKLSMATPERLRAVLDTAGKQFKAIDPTSWPEQARLLVHREFSKLKQYKDYIG